MNIKLLHKKLIQKKLTISVAESCTGGLLANNLTKLSNASKYFQIGLITSVSYTHLTLPTICSV